MHICAHIKLMCLYVCFMWATCHTKNFICMLQMVRLEFAHYDYKLRETISAKDFALSMVASADMKHLNKFLDRVDELNGSNLSNIRITFEEFKNFAELRKRLQPFSMALFSYGKANVLLTRKDFQRAASQVCYSFFLFYQVLRFRFLDT